MKITIRNLGVIREAEIDLKPLTVFIGENGTGKTWAAYALAALLGPYGYEQYMKFYSEDRTEFQYAPIEEAIRQLTKKGNAKINLTEFVKSYAEIYINEIASFAPEWLNSFMATKRVNFDEVKIHTKLSQAFTQRILNKLRRFRIKERFVVAKTLEFNLLKEEKSDELYYYTKSQTRASEEMPQAIVRKEIRDFVLLSTLKTIRMALFSNTPVFPSERTTFTTMPLRFIRNQAEKVYEKGNDTDTENYAMLSEPVRYFLSMISGSHEMFFRRKMLKRQHPEIAGFVHLAEILEKEILLGDITFEEYGDKIEILYKLPQGTNLELNISSSMVKQLAPLALYLKYLAAPGDLLIIDEPEMDLHPATQVEMAEFLGMLANAGLYVLITTHSPYIVDHLTNLIHAKECDPEKDVKEYFYLEQENSFISKENISVYLFEENTAKNILKENGQIDWETFNYVSLDISGIYADMVR